MLRNRYCRTDLFALEPQLGVLFEPQLELLDEVEGAVITGYAIVERAGGQDQLYLAESLEDHQRRFGRASGLLAADRGLASAANERLARATGFKQVALPHVGEPPWDDRRRGKISGSGGPTGSGRESRGESTRFGAIMG